jgi:thiamine monophosphate kinase
MAPKKRSDALAIAAAAGAEAAKVPAPSTSTAAVWSADMVTTAVHIPKDMHDLLRRVAYKRALASGGRPSASAILVELVLRHRDELEREAR